MNPGELRLTDRVVSIGSRVDSTYEYMIKEYIRSNSNKKKQYLKDWFDHAMDIIIRDLVQVSNGQKKLLFVGEIQNGQLVPKMDHLVCFLPGTLMLAANVTKNDTNRKNNYIQFAKKLMDTCIEISLNTPIHLSPEIVYFNIAKNNDKKFFKFEKDFEIHESSAHNLLRPETIESLFYMWRFTHNKKYRDAGWKIFQNWKKYAKVILVVIVV